MYYVYLLRSKVLGRCYVGWTKDLRRRLSEHDRGNNSTTRRWPALQLVFYEAFLNEDDSRRREKYLKTSKGRSSLKQILRCSF